MNINIKKYIDLSIIIIGIILYFLFFAIFYLYSPSAIACLKNGNNAFGILFLSSITGLLFLTLYLLFLGNISNPTGLFILITICVLNASLGVFFYNRCYKINSSITNNVDSSPIIHQLTSKYRGIMQTQPLVNCVTYHTGEYYDTKELQCVQIDSCPTSAGMVCDPQKGAKLVDFYICSSYQSCHVPIHNTHYVSTNMIKALIVAGVRLFDFNIYAEVTNDGIIPVVRSDINDKLSQNYIPLDDVFDTLATYAFLDYYGGDPIFIHLNIKTNNIEVIDNIAKQYIEYFGQYLLEPRFSYLSEKSITIQPICHLFHKLILIVTGETSHTYLDELINIHTSKNGRILTAKQVRKPVDPKAFVFSNQSIFTLMTPEKFKNNTNPSSAFTHGVQAPMMNFWSMDSKMKNYSEFFKLSSFVIKNLSLQQDRMTSNSIEESTNISDSIKDELS
tara:strand:+ start:2459 stop:3799 length:1341 start_codon:yes stop_codon:yes gene_type:complete